MSNKADAEGFAKRAVERGYQVLSFDLPEHGERINENYQCNVWNGVHDLTKIAEYVEQNWSNISLFANSLGAYFCLLALKDVPIRNCLFLSPILDMEHLIQEQLDFLNKWICKCLSFTIGTMTKTMKVTIGTGTGKLDPIDAIKQSNYVGYSNEEAGTLKRIAEIIKQYNLDSNTLSAEEKIRLIQTFFRETRDCNKQSNKDGNIAYVVFNGHGNYEILEFYAYAQTFGLFCDYLGIPVKFVDGFSFLPDSNDFIPVHWNKVEINGTWYYIDSFLNARYNISDNFLSEKLWEDHEICKEGSFADLYYTGNTNIKYHLLLSQEEYKEESIWKVE